jgi:hypothetical protein
MKHFQIIVFLCGIVGITAFSCKKANNQNSRNKTSFEQNNIEFKFYLLNETKKPAISFKEGENFSFFFLLTNKRNDSLYLDNSFFTDEDKFCTVFSENNSLIGRPFIYKAIDLIGSAAHPFFEDKKKYELTIPWQDNRDEWETLHCHLESTHQNLLPKGKYYTIFKHRFCFDRKGDQPSLCMDSIIFRINFEIK